MYTSVASLLSPGFKIAEKLITLEKITVTAVIYKT